MSSEDTRIGNEFKFQISDGNSPPTFSNFCAVTDVGELGEEKPLIDVTALCDDARKYRPGLADGVEIPLKCNFIDGDEGILQLYRQYQSEEVADFRLALDDSSPDEYFEFSAIVRAWKLGLPLGEKASVTFSLKITGGVTWVNPT